MIKKENVIQEKSFQFALKVIGLYKILQEQREYIISKQLLRSATSIGANVQESSAAFSRKDFIYKISISSKEARETKYWLSLLQESDLVEIELKEYINDVEELIRILTAIVKSSQVQSN
ncbi:MAG: four helix bundle protein [Flavobacteriales bacterium]|nr:four helix bundle protein [Flavobacteriales bacterium]